MKYFTKTTLNNLRLQPNQCTRHRQRSLDVTLACKLTLTYGKYHLMMDYRQLVMSKYQMTYQEAERQAEMMRSTIVASLAKNQITIVHHSTADFLDTPEDRMNDNADALLWYQQGKIGYEEFCMQFQELSWMDGSRTPLDGKRHKMYIMSMREVVEMYKAIAGNYLNMQSLLIMSKK